MSYDTISQREAKTTPGNTAALIRCRSIGPREKALFDYLAAYFGDDAVWFVMDGTKQQASPEQADHGATVVMSRELIQSLGIPLTHDAAWRFGDYCYYAARHALKDRFDYYWLIEDDVLINFDKPSDFFDIFTGNSADFLAPTFGPRGAEWYWSRSVGAYLGERVYGCLFPITRLSGKAVDHLALQRAAMCALPGDLDARGYPNDEAFVSTTLARDGFICQNLNAIAPENCFSSDVFHSEFPVMPEEAYLSQRKNVVLHPVRTCEDARKKFDTMRVKFQKKYTEKRNFIISNFDEETWLAWSGEQRGIDDMSDLQARYESLADQEKTKPPVHVHLGYHKTGTTSIQQILMINKNLLSRYHIVNQRDQSSQAARVSCQKLLGRPTDQISGSIQEIVEAFNAIDAAAGEKPIIISDEEIFGFIPGRHGYWKLYDKAGVIMQAIAVAFPQREVRFFAYTRPIFPWLVSVHTEAVKNHHLKLGLEDFLKALDFEGDLVTRSDSLRAEVCHNSFVTADMSVDKNQPLGLGSAMFRWAELTEDEIAAMQLPNRENESVPADMKEVFLLLNRHGFSGEALMTLKNNILAALRRNGNATRTSQG